MSGVSDTELTERLRLAVLDALTQKTGLRGAEQLAEAVRRGAITEEAAQAVLDELYPASMEGTP